MHVNPSPFLPAYDPKKTLLSPFEKIVNLPEGYWFLFHQQNLLLAKGCIPEVLHSNSPSSLQSPTLGSAETGFEDSPAPTIDREATAMADPSIPTDLTWVLPHMERACYFGSLYGKPCWAAALSLAGADSGSASLNLPPAWEGINLRLAYGRLAPEQLQASRFAAHLLYWDKNSRYCGACGHPTVDKEDERAKICSTCGSVFYPKISPAVIVAILHGDRILLAHNRRFVTKFYSLIAGFVEIGESLEDCVHREVLEEVGVQVTNIRYFSSQPWPTPDSLMIGFLADYANGEVQIQDDELHDARWFSPPDMPSLPPTDSIARKILKWFEMEYVPKVRITQPHA